MPIIVTTPLQQVAENHAGEFVVFSKKNALLVGMDFRNLLFVLESSLPSADPQ